MCTADVSASDMDWGCDDLLWGEHMHSEADSGDIRDRVCGSDLVEMDLLDGLSMDMRLRLGNQMVNRNNIFFDLIRQI